MGKRAFSRRDFLKMSAAAAAGTTLVSQLPYYRALAQDPVNIRLLAWGDDTEVSAREATLALFHEQNPGIRVEFVHVPNADYGTKLQTMLAGGDYPDVFFLGNGDVPAYVTRGQLLGLDDRIARDSFDLSDVFPANLALYNVDEAQYGFPVDAPSQQVFYNASRFEAAGIEPPSSDWTDESWTWDAFLEKAIALTDAENNLWGWQVKTGFRFAKGGAAEYFGITPDLATFAKAMGNGYPAAAFGGRAEVMAMLPDKVSHGGTYAGNRVAAAAAVKTLEIIRDTPALETIHATGLRVQDGLREILNPVGIPYHFTGHPSMFGIMFREEEASEYRDWATTDHELYDAIAIGMHARGAMPEPDSREPWFMCEAHAKGDIVDRVLTAFEDSLAVALEARAHGAG